jgi:hypothetical protein
VTATATIDGEALPYSVNAADGSYAFQVGGETYRFRQWTWGEKNRVVDASTTLDVETGRLRVDIARFNELMLATCLVPACAPEALRELNPVLGDRLLAVAYWVSEVPVQDKKRADASGTGASGPPGSDTVSAVSGVRVDAVAGARADGGRHREVRSDPRRAGAPVGADAGR